MMTFFIRCKRKDLQTSSDDLPKSRKNSSLSSCSRCLSSYSEDLRDKTNNVQDEINQLKAEIIELQSSQAALLQQQQIQQPEPSYQESTPSSFLAKRYVLQTSLNSQTTILTKPATVSLFQPIHEEQQVQQSQELTFTPSILSAQTPFRAQSTTSNVSSITDITSNTSSIQASSQQETAIIIKSLSNGSDHRRNTYENQPYKSVSSISSGVNKSMNDTSCEQKSPNSSIHSTLAIVPDKTDNNRQSAQQSVTPMHDSANLQNQTLSAQAPRLSSPKFSCTVRTISSCSSDSRPSSIHQASPSPFSPVSSNNSRISSIAGSLSSLSSTICSSVQQDTLTSQNLSRFSDSAENIKSSSPSSLDTVLSTSPSPVNLSYARNKSQNNNIPQGNTRCEPTSRLFSNQGLRPNLLTKERENNFQTNQAIRPKFSTLIPNVNMSTNTQYKPTPHTITPNELKNLTQYTAQLHNFRAPRMSAVQNPQTNRIFWKYINTFMNGNRGSTAIMNNRISRNMVFPQQYRCAVNRIRPINNTLYFR
ncbi:unnamed protein product [Didymodactylos carnosus]|uniref:Uncharacterized protein n=1 Tax=Didymodactylos carnosus TaxID=1234261 RepID=A0A815KLE7_9BILA|nr:unnamed protein product [Didymodactylos carnosus]CAF4289096.1 unnamed protein product [Didymodactylos carnosus]